MVYDPVLQGMLGWSQALPILPYYRWGKRLAPKCPTPYCQYVYTDYISPDVVVQRNFTALAASCLARLASLMGRLADARVADEESLVAGRTLPDHSASPELHLLGASH